MASRRDWWRLVVGLIVFSAAFGYLEAAVVVYLRALYAPVRMHFYPSISATDLFPLITTEQLSSLGEQHALRLRTELGREAATIAMLAGVAIVAARNLREWVAAFVFCFGIWDIVFYLSLELLLNWPRSILAWDILFLLPVPWVGPVLAPVLISISMVAAGFTVLWREYRGRPLSITRLRWAAILAGGAIVVLAFVWDFRNTIHGGNPNPFNWALFFTGELFGLLAFAGALRSTR
ncbi:MAG: hypothetical protein JOY62_02355 [Acidobacteriaceae bacterium]|nr:hypothetical protein [Acidobacteriaceae bacterium]MBV9778791.1 hypothetical protein [Acidobacteriaceae bacterium]